VGLVDRILNLSFLWHQHQPYYKDLLSGKYLLPWVRLHGVKDYLDMVEILTPHPKIKQTFNMVPSLLEQLEDYASGVALDPHLELSLKKIEELTADDKILMLELLFQAHYDTMIGPSQRYAMLHRERKRAMAEWGPEEWRDLQVLANLAWIDPMFKSSGRMKELNIKGERYTEEEKRDVLDFQRQLIQRIVPSLKAHIESGQIEVSVTPYFHPIMPLLYDTSSALVAMPGASLPQRRFQHPEDVDRHLAETVVMYERLFGRKPVGLWPSEGSVSEEIIPIICKHGFKWIATDEEILSESLGVPARLDWPNSLINTGELYHSYGFQKDEANISIFFRDHALSDNIGFVYSGWDPEKAADDFMGKLWAINENLTRKNIPNPIVSVILDGENAWEYYKNDGHDFLEALYLKIENAPWLNTCTFEQYLGNNPNSGQLKKLFAGSWISHNFAVWIGHAEDNKAWDLLGKARDELAAFEASNPDFDPAKLKLAWKEIMISEGSDWCWWFGPDHVGPNNDDFDRLFRSHLANVYLLTDREPPSELFQPVRTSFIEAHYLRPVDFIKPIVDGKVTHYYEWQAAGHFDCNKAGSTMHKAERLLSGIWFGFDDSRLYFRLDKGITVESKRFKEYAFEIEFINSGKLAVTAYPSERRCEFNGHLNPDIDFAYLDNLEIAIPIEILPKPEHDEYLIRVIVLEAGKPLESWPPSEALKIELPNPREIPWGV